MNYKLLKGGHLPDRKCREILELFCDDLTATQIADICRVSRVTVNNYFRIIRSAIAAFCEAGLNEGQQSLVFNNGVTYNSVESPAAYYGFWLNEGKVYTAWLKNIGLAAIQQMHQYGHWAEKEKPVLGFEAYHAVADCNYWRLYWLAANKGSSSEANLLSEITGFWTHAKSRLQKFRGMNKNTLYLHIKECEFRYNFRNDDLLIVLSHIINDRWHSTNKGVENAVVG